MLGLPLTLLAITAALVFAQPRPTFVHVPEETAPVSAPFTIEGTLTGGSFSAVVLKVRGGDDGYAEVPLELQYGELYRVKLPPSRMVPPGIEYYVEGVTAQGARVPLLASKARPIRVTVRAEVPRFETDEAEAVPAPRKRAPEPIAEWVEVPEPTVAPRVSKSPSGPQLRALEEELKLYSSEVPEAIERRVEDSARGGPREVTVVDALTMRRMGARYVSEVLELLAGITVSRDVQGFYRIAVRGLRSAAEVLVTLDGQRLNNFYDGQALLHLPVDNLERLELVRGPATADVELGNVIAVVNLFTRGDSGLRVSAAGGSFEAFDGHANAAGTFGRVRLQGDVDVVSQYGARREVLRDGLDTATTARPKITDDQRLLVNAGAGVVIDADAAGTFEVKGRLLYENRGALIGAFDVVGPSSELEWLIGRAQLGWKKSLSPGVTLGVRGSFDLQSTRRLFQLAPAGWQVVATNPATLFPDGVLEQSALGTRSLGLEARLDAKLPFSNQLVATLFVQQHAIFFDELTTNVVAATNVNVGALVRPEGLRLATEDGVGGRGPAADRFVFGASLADTWTPIEALTVQAGVRLDLVQLPVGDVTGEWLGTRLTPAVGPRVGVVVRPITSLAFRASYGRSFRAPTPNELADVVPDNTFNQGRFIGNPTLEGAALDAVEAGFDAAQGLGGGQLMLRGTAFFERLSNAISMVDSTGNLAPYTNRLLGVQSLGAEGEARFELASRLAVWVNVSWVRAEDLTAPTQSRILTDVPQLRANGGFTFPVGPFLNVDLSARAFSERRNNSRSVLELTRRYSLPPGLVVNAQLRTEKLFNHLELVLLGQNAFDLQYADDAIRPDRIPGGVPRERWQVFGQARVEL